MLRFIKGLLGFIIFIAVIAVIGRVLFFRIARIDSYSMIPNLVAGDYFLVYTRGTLGPGSIAVCRNPEDSSTMVSLRIEGIPGSTIKMGGNHLYLNGRIVQQQLSAPLIYVDNNSSEHLEYAVSPAEENVAGNSYVVGLMDQAGEDSFPQQDVENGFFLIGDNRNMSYDSRDFGEVPIENCIGSAFLIIWPGPDSGDFKRWHRILEWIS